MLKLVDSHDLKSCGFSRPSSSLGEATFYGKKQVGTKDSVFSASTKKTTKNCIQCIYDNVYDMICCIRYEKKKSSSSSRDYTNSRLKILALLGVPVRVWPRAPLND